MPAGRRSNVEGAEGEEGEGIGGCGGAKPSFSVPPRLCSHRSICSCLQFLFLNTGLRAWGCCGENSHPVGTHIVPSTYIHILAPSWMSFSFFSWSSDCMSAT